MKFLRFILFPFALLYDIITSIRNYFFDIGVLKSVSFDVPVIAVGNLSVGGTGKTPQIEYLVRLLKNDYKVAILSRGYKRKTKGFIKLNDSHSATDVGDEPLQYYKKFGKNVIVSVDADRVDGVSQLIKNEDIDVVLLDDAYQHRYVKAKSYILLTKYKNLYVDDYLLPTGNLRESRRGANRAETIIVTKCPSKLSLEEQKTIQKRLKLSVNQQLFFTSISYDEVLKGSTPLGVSDLENKEIVLVTGIANPKPLLHYLNGKKIKFKHLNYPDHYSFTEDDISKIKTISNGKIILTTEKDYVRLNNRVGNLYYIGITTTFLNNKLKFDDKIKSIIKK